MSRMTQEQKDALWAAIEAHVPEGADFICFVRYDQTKGEMIGTFDGDDLDEFVKKTLASFVNTKYRA